MQMLVAITMSPCSCAQGNFVFLWGNKTKSESIHSQWDFIFTGEKLPAGDCTFLEVFFLLSSTKLCFARSTPRPRSKQINCALAQCSFFLFDAEKRENTVPLSPVAHLSFRVRA
jgi:hypothetical protein